MLFRRKVTFDGPTEECPIKVPWEEKWEESDRQFRDRINAASEKMLNIKIVISRAKICQKENDQ